MRRCETCRFRDGYAVFKAGEIDVPSGWCHRGPPNTSAPGVSEWPPIALKSKCGEHRFSLATLIRAILRKPRRA